MAEEMSIKVLQNANDDETGQSFYAGGEHLLPADQAHRLLAAGVAEELPEEEAQEQPASAATPVAGSGGRAKPAKQVSPAKENDSSKE